MINIDLTNQDIYTDNASLFQWDYGQSLVISGLSVTGDVQVHFARKNTDAEIRMGTYTDSKITVAIPDVILQKSGMFHAYIYLTNETSGETVKVINMNVREREKPTDYTSEPYVDVVQELSSKLNQIIETGIANYEPDPAVIDALVTAKVNDMIGDLGALASKDSVAKTDLSLALATEIDGKIPSSKITTTLSPTATGFVHDAKTVGDAITMINGSLSVQNGTITSTYINTSGIVLKKEGKKVFLYGSFTLTQSIPVLTDVQIGTLPSGFYPAISVGQYLYQVNIANHVLISIKTSGEIMAFVYGSTALADRYQIGCNFAYFTT